jgi:triacylglycerol lipase
MLARIQQLIVLTVFAAATTWAVVCLRNGFLLWAGAGLAFIVAGYAATIGLEFWLLWRSYPTPDASRPAVRELLSAWWSEVAVAPRVFLWRQPFRSNSIPDLVSPGNAGGHGVVLVHGFFCNRGIWNPWLQRLRQSNVPFIALTLEPVFGSIDDYAVEIEAAVARIAAATGSAPVILAHSMGGLAVRAWLKRVAGQRRLHRIVTIATPHCGTAMARRALATNVRQMRVGSAWLEALGHEESSASVSRLFTCFWSRCDNIVFPTGSATLAGADNRELRATPHVRMVYHPEVIAEILRLVAPP